MKKIILSFTLIISLMFSTSVFAKDFILNENQVYVSGETIGLRLNSGVLITKMYSVNVNGETIKPWENANLEIGDVILKVNDVNIISADGLIGALKVNGEKQCNIQLLRDEQLVSTHITPISYEGNISLGIYVKDNILGVGTMTFITQEDLDYASLGHQIATKVNTDSGYIYKAEVTGVDKSIKGNPGSKKAVIDEGVIGEIELNTNKGIYGTYTDSIANLDLYYVAAKEEVKKGSAQILTCINGTEVKSYSIEIISVTLNTSDDIKGIKFKITDEELLNYTGGVIQGMSGSPIIQDGKLIGAVTHVIVNTPEYGYGLFAENMLRELDYDIIK
ncbi:MAG: SpoIVB peptidase S55 domain-containing protein [bacterium]